MLTESRDLIRPQVSEFNGSLIRGPRRHKGTAYDASVMWDAESDMESFYGELEHWCAAHNKRISWVSDFDAERGYLYSYHSVS